MHDAALARARWLLDHTVCECGHGRRQHYTGPVGHGVCSLERCACQQFQPVAFVVERAG